MADEKRFDCGCIRAVNGVLGPWKIACQKHLLASRKFYTRTIR